MTLLDRAFPHGEDDVDVVFIVFQGFDTSAEEMRLRSVLFPDIYGYAD